MLKPHPTLARLSEAGFATLLRERLVAHASDNPRSKLLSMDLFERTELNWRTPLDAFTLFYKGLDPAFQTPFRAAIGRALRQARPGHFPDDGVALLLVLAGNIQAHEAIEAVVDSLIDGGKWGARIPSLFVDALAILKGMAPSLEAYDHGTRLAGNSDFPSWLVFDALEVLLAGRSSAWAKSIVTLLPVLSKATTDGPPAVERGQARETWFEGRLKKLVATRLRPLSPQTVVNGLRELGPLLGLDVAQELVFGRPLGSLLVLLLEPPDGAFTTIEGKGGIKWLAPSGSSVIQRALWPEDAAPVDIFLFERGVRCREDVLSRERAELLAAVPSESKLHQQIEDLLS